jgi:hypothetical protein
VSRALILSIPGICLGALCLFVSGTAFAGVQGKKAAEIARSPILAAAYSPELPNRDILLRASDQNEAASSELLRVAHGGVESVAVELLRASRPG